MNVVTVMAAVKATTAASTQLKADSVDAQRQDRSWPSNRPPARASGACGAACGGAIGVRPRSTAARCTSEPRQRRTAGRKRLWRVIAVRRADRASGHADPARSAPERPRGVWTRSRHAEVGWIAAAAAMQALSMLMFAAQQRALLQAWGVRFPLGRAMSVTLARSAISISLPAGAAVSAAYALAALSPCRRQPRDRDRHDDRVRPRVDRRPGRALHHRCPRHRHAETRRSSGPSRRPRSRSRPSSSSASWPA